MKLKAIFGTFIDIYCDILGIFAFTLSFLGIFTANFVLGLDIAIYIRISVLMGAT